MDGEPPEFLRLRPYLARGIELDSNGDRVKQKILSVRFDATDIRERRSAFDPVTKEFIGDNP